MQPSKFKTTHLDASVRVHPADAAEQAVDLFADGLDEPEHDPVDDRLVGRRRRSLDLAVDRDDVVDDLLDVVSCIGGFWAPGPVKLSSVHGWLDDGHNRLALQLHVGLEKLQMLNDFEHDFFLCFGRQNEAWCHKQPLK